VPKPWKLPNLVHGIFTELPKINLFLFDPGSDPLQYPHFFFRFLNIFFAFFFLKKRRLTYIQKENSVIIERIISSKVQFSRSISDHLTTKCQTLHTSRSVPFFIFLIIFFGELRFASFNNARMIFILQSIAKYVKNRTKNP